MAGRVGLGAGDGKRAGWFEHCPRILENILDRRANGVGVDQNHFIDIHLTEAKGFLADVLDRRPIGKQPDVLQSDALAGVQRTRHGIGVGSLDTDDPGFRPQTLDVSSDAGNQAAAANATEDRMNGLRVLAQDFHADRTLPGDHLRIVERMHESQLLGFLEFECVRVGVIVGLARQDHLGASRLHRLHLDLRRRRRHHDHRPATHLVRGQGDALRMIPGGRADYPALELFF